MVILLKQLGKAVLSVLLLTPALVSAGSAELNEAVKQYYAGNTEQALGILEPVAMDGDVDAQYLMGNILYSLSKTEKYRNSGDPIKWYQMAADQGIADASYALGVIYHNSWSESRDRQHAALAITNFQKAIDAGYSKASVPLNKLKAKTGMSTKTAEKLARKASKVVIAGSESGEKIEEEKKEQETVKQAEKEVEVIAKAETLEPVSKLETPVVEPVKVEPAKTKVAKTEAAMEHEVATDQPEQKELAESISSPVDSGNNSIVSLAKLADECSNYTQIGYNYYAESIKGASFTGVATITKLRPSNSSTRLVNLESDKFDVVVVISLINVPKRVATTLKVGQDMNLSATIEHSQIIGSSCAIELSYQLPES